MSAQKIYQTPPGSAVTEPVDAPLRAAAGAVTPATAALGGTGTVLPQRGRPAYGGEQLVGAHHECVLPPAAGPLRAGLGDLRTHRPLVYYEEGHTDVKVAPDVFVAFGMKNEDQYWYRGQGPGLRN